MTDDPSLLRRYVEEGSQEASLALVAGDWAKRDPGAALQHVRQLTGISEATRDRMLAAISAAGGAGAK